MLGQRTDVSIERNYRRFAPNNFGQRFYFPAHDLFFFYAPTFDKESSNPKCENESDKKPDPISKNFIKFDFSIDVGAPLVYSYKKP